MEIIDLPQGEGKTAALVDLMLEPGNEDVVYVAPTYAQADYARKLAVAKFGGVEPLGFRLRFTSASGVLSYSGPRRRYVVDELDTTLSVLLGGGVVAMACTSVSE